MLTLPAMATDNGGEPMAFLKLGAGARATGMGGAYTAVADDAAGILYNPAGFIKVRGLQFIAETYILSFGRSINYISTCKPFPVGNSLFAAGISWLNYSAGQDIEARSTNSTDPESTISDSTHIFIFSGAARISRKFSFGGNVRVYLETLDGTKGLGAGFDLGAMLNIMEGLNAGFSVLNMSTTLDWDNTVYKESLPQTYNLGVSYFVPSVFSINKLDVLASADGVYNSFGFFKFRPGVEITANDLFFFRAGYNGAISLGMGFRFSPSPVFSAKFDYAFSNDQILDGSFNHRIGLTVEYMTQGTGGEAGGAAEKSQEGKKNEEAW